MVKNLKTFALLGLCISATTLTMAQNREGGDPKLSEYYEPEPRVVTPGKSPSEAPSDAIILFDGKDASRWQSSRGGGDVKWKVENGAMTVVRGTGNITSKDKFGDFQLHIEWRTPAEVKGDGQGRGNSGIFLMDKYELQVLDSYKNRTYSNGQAGSIYKQLPPMVNATRPPGEWQVYDVVFTAPRFYENGSIKSQASITVIHNGVLIQNNASIWGATEYIGIPVYNKHSDKEPITLQDHGDAVSFRNIWVRPL